MVTFEEFTQREIDGIRAKLAEAELKSRPMQPCKDGKRHKWNYEPPNLMVRIKPRPTTCKVCEITFRRPTFMAADLRQYWQERLARLLDGIQKK